MEMFFLRPQFINTLFIVRRARALIQRYLMTIVNILFFSGSHLCFAYLRFGQTYLWGIGAFKEKK